MSVEAMVWALNSVVGDATRKLVLVAYANHAHRDGANAWASAATIAEYAECSERTVQRHTSTLITDGFLREGDQEVIPVKIPKRYRPIVYDLAMSEDVRAEWLANPVAGRREAMVAGGRRGAQARNLLRSVPEVGRQIDAPSDPATDSDDTDTSGHIDASRGDIRGDIRGDASVTQTKEKTKRQPRASKPASATPPPDDDQSLLPDLPTPPPTLDQQVEAFLRAWWDWVMANQPNRLPSQSYPTVKGIVRTAISNGKPPRLIEAALGLLITQGKSISGGTLQNAMTEVASYPTAPAEFKPFAIPDSDGRSARPAPRHVEAGLARDVDPPEYDPVRERIERQRALRAAK